MLHGAAAPDRTEAEAIVSRYGRTPLDYFKLWPDKLYFFSSSHASVVAYRVAWSIAISLGDPVGPAEELASVVRSFVDFCAGRGWRAAFHQVAPDLLAVYRRLGFAVLKIGEEALVDLERFATQTSQQRSFRKPTRHLEAQGYRVAREEPPHPEALLDEVEEVSREWLSLPGRGERAFALGRLRHRPTAANGLMDYLFSELMLHLREDGYRWFSLGLAPLAGVGIRRDATLEERALHGIHEHLTMLFSFKGLRSYNAKFEPVWEERFLVYQNGHAGFVRAALALERITSGGA